MCANIVCIVGGVVQCVIIFFVLLGLLAGEKEVGHVFGGIPR